MPENCAGGNTGVFVNGRELHQKDLDLLAKIRKLADDYLGMQEMVMVVKEGGEKRALKMPFKVDVCKELIGKMEEIVGKDNIKVA